MIEKEVLGAIAAFIALASHIPYMIATYKGRKKPHVFTWIIWSITTSIVFAGQLYDHAAAGAWGTASGAIACLLIAILAYYKNPRSIITRSDWMSLCAAFCSLVLWWLTQDPLWTMVLLIVVDAIGYFPTFRKAYALPNEESGWLFIVQNIKHCFSIAAMGNYSIVTLLFPITIFVMNMGVPVFIFLGKRRSKLI